jgi:hypothetical protein
MIYKINVEGFLNYGYNQLQLLNHDIKINCLKQDLNKSILREIKNLFPDADITINKATILN